MGKQFICEKCGGGHWKPHGEGVRVIVLFKKIIPLESLRFPLFIALLIIGTILTGWLSASYTL